MRRSRVKAMRGDSGHREVGTDGCRLAVWMTIALALVSVRPGAAQVDFAAIRATKELEAVRISDPIVIDGRLDEPVWARAPVARDFVQQEPIEGAVSTERSEVRVLYDADALYVGGTLYDSDPRGGIVNELKRDFATYDGDTAGVILDTFNKQLENSNFLTNPAGAQRDSQNYDDGRESNANWDAVWWVKTARFDGGWTMEMKIPFKALRFRKQEEQVWGINLLRVIRRKNERTWWSPQPRQFRSFKPSYAGRLTGLGGISPGLNLYVKPFFTSALSNLTLPNLDRRYDADGGLDVKYGIGSALTLDLTYRTDFSQVEVDAQQINLTRFSLFFPEKREFFLENQGAFRIGDTRQQRDLLPFFSRRIGLSAAGQPVPILGGLRLTGRQGPLTLGLVNMQTEAFGDRPGENFAAARVGRDTGTSSIAGFYLGREASGPAGFNRVAGGEVRLKFSQTIDVSGFVMGSAASGNLTGAAGRAAFNMSENRYTGQLSYTNITPQFRNDVGFFPRGDIGLVAWHAAQHFRPDRLSRWVRTFSFGTRGERFENSRHEGLLSRRLRAYAVQEFADGGQLDTAVNWHHELLTEPFEVSDGIIIPPGEYQFRQLTPSLSSDRSRWVSGTFAYTGGGFYSGTIRGYSGGLRLRVDEHLATSADYDYNEVDLPEGRFTTKLARFRIDSSFNTTMFLNAFVQYNSEAHSWLTNVRYRLNYRPLSDIYLVYTETRTNGSKDRTVAIKHTISLSF